MAFLDFLSGKKAQTRQIPKFSPQQEQVLSQLREGGSKLLPGVFDYLSNILGQTPESTAAFEAPTRRAFQEQTLPTIAERFSGLGAQKSSAFGQQLGEAGKRLEEGLSSQRAQLGGQAISQLRELLGGGLGSQFESIDEPRESGALEDLLRAILPILGKLGGGYAGKKLGLGDSEIGSYNF